MCSSSANEYMGGSSTSHVCQRSTARRASSPYDSCEDTEYFYVTRPYLYTDAGTNHKRHVIHVNHGKNNY